MSVGVTTDQKQTNSPFYCVFNNFDLGFIITLLIHSE